MPQILGILIGICQPEHADCPALPSYSTWLKAGNRSRLAAQELGLSVPALLQQALRLADDPEVQAEHPDMSGQW